MREFHCGHRSFVCRCSCSLLCCCDDFIAALVAVTAITIVDVDVINTVITKSQQRLLLLTRPQSCQSHVLQPKQHCACTVGASAGFKKRAQTRNTLDALVFHLPHRSTSLKCATRCRCCITSCTISTASLKSSQKARERALSR